MFSKFSNTKVQLHSKTYLNFQDMVNSQRSLLIITPPPNDLYYVSKMSVIWNSVRTVYLAQTHISQVLLLRIKMR